METGSAMCQQRQRLEMKSSHRGIINKHVVAHYSHPAVGSLLGCHLQICFHMLLQSYKSLLSFVMIVYIGMLRFCILYHILEILNKIYIFS